MRTIYHKIEFHYTYLIMALGFVLTGHFLNLIIFTSLILIHELGHITISRLFKYQIDKVIIYPYGGLTKLNTIINTKIDKDFFISISGLIFQLIYFLFISFFFNKGLLREYTYHLFALYHRSMFIFNLLPIIPLDGSKMINLILSKYVSYNLANKITVIISLLTIILSLKFEIFARNYSTLLTLSILFRNIYTFYQMIEYLYQKFLLERYLYKFNYPKIKIIKNYRQMYKNKNHFFCDNNKIISENDYLHHFFYKNH